MSENEELLSLKAVLYGCARYCNEKGGGLFITSDPNTEKKQTITYDNAMSNVIDLIEKLESEVEE